MIFNHQLKIPDLDIFENGEHNIKNDFAFPDYNFLCSSSQLWELPTMSLGAIMNTSTLTPTFDGEFNSFVSSPDGSTGLWKTTMANGNRTLGSNGEEEYYSDSSVGVNPFSVNNGVLDITAAPGSNPLGLPYNSGVITTQGSFNQLYGYFEIDAEMPAGQGLWPAFWLLPESGAWPPELDVFEVLGNAPSTLYFSTHSSVQATQGTTLNVANVSSGFNLYGVMWGPQTVDLYINNVEVASMPTPADMDVPMYMLANLAVGGYWPGDPNSTTPFPATMQIAYVKAFAYPGTTGGTVYDTLPSQNIGAAAVAPVLTTPATLQVQTGVATTVAGVSVAANWPGGDFTVTVSDSEGLLQTSATTDVFTSGEGTTSITLIGNLVPINAALATLTYQGQSAGSENLWISATDPQGQQSLTSLVVTDGAGTPPVTPPPVTPPPVTTPTGTTPVVNTPGTFTLAAGTNEALSGVSVTDSQMSSDPTVVISDSTGLLHTTATSGVTEQGEGTTSLTLVGSLTAIDTELATLTYQAGASAGTDWLWVSGDTGTGGQVLSHTVVTVTAAATVPVSPAGSPPVLQTPATVSVVAGVSQALSGVNVTDSQTSGVLSVVLSDGTGLLKTTATSGVTELGENSTSLTLTGSVAALNTELASLTYKGSAAGADWLWVSATDATGDQVLDHTVVTVTAAPVVVKPVVNAPATLSTVAGATSALAGVTVTDTQSSGVFTVVLSDSTGLLKTSVTSGVTEAGENSTTVTLTGALAALNTNLATLTYQGSAAGTDQLSVSATDATGNNVVANTAVTVTAAPVVAKPVANIPATLSTVAGATSALAGVTVTDAQASGVFTVVLSDSTGLLKTSATSGVTEVGENSTSLTLTGSLAALNAELAGLTYKGSAAGTDWLWMSATDATGNQVLNHTVVTVTPAPVVVTPVVKAPASLALTASTSAALTGVSVTDSNATSTLTIKVSDSTGLLTTTATSGVTAQGEGSAALTLTGTDAAINTELATMTYKAGASAGTDLIWVSANDPDGSQGLNSVPVTIAAAAPNPTVKLTGVMLGLPNTAVFVQATLTDNLGLLSTSSGFGVTATGEGSTHLILQGIASSVNAELATLTYTGGSSYPAAGAADTLTIGVQGMTGNHLLSSVLPLLDGHLTT
jgi:beta-glucanase (GH16 family)